MILRDATPGDAARLEEIRVSAWRNAYSGKAEKDVFDMLTRAPEGGVQDWTQMIVHAHLITSVRVTEDDGTIAGFCAVAAPSRDHDEPEGIAEIVALYVDPDTYRRGYGRALLDDAVERLAADDWREATVWTLEDNFRSLPLYESRGFKPDGSTRTDPGWFVADVRLRKPLTPAGT